MRMRAVACFDLGIPDYHGLSGYLPPCYETTRSWCSIWELRDQFDIVRSSWGGCWGAEISWHFKNYEMCTMISYFFMVNTHTHKIHKITNDSPRGIFSPWLLMRLLFWDTLISPIVGVWSPKMNRFLMGHWYRYTLHMQCKTQDSSSSPPRWHCNFMIC